VLTAELVVTGRSVFGTETAMENLESYKTPEKRPAELIQIVAETPHFQMRNMCSYIKE